MMTTKGDDPMDQLMRPRMTHEPSLETIEMVCERLGELGMPIGPDTARDLARAILEMEAPRMEAHVRDAIETSLDTIRVATQSALGVLVSDRTSHRLVTPPVRRSRCSTLRLNRGRRPRGVRPPASGIPSRVEAGRAVGRAAPTFPPRRSRAAAGTIRRR